jgi:hypothetical protein
MSDDTPTTVIMTLPSGEKEQLLCEGCACTQFNLFSESRDGDVQLFHTVCTACGERGALTVQVEYTQKYEFLQSVGIAEGVLTDYTMTYTTGPAEDPSE